jgi:hypothetical protein
MNFSHSDKVRELQQRVSAFMERFVYSAESRFQDEVARRGGAGVSQDFLLAHAYAGARSLRLADGPDESAPRADWQARAVPVPSSLRAHRVG